MARGTTPTSPTPSIVSCRSACRAPTASSRISSRSANKKGRHDFSRRPNHQFTNSPIYQLTNSPTHQFTNSPIHQLTNSPILLEGVPEAEHHHVDVRPCRRKNRRRLERRRDEVPAGRLQVVGEAALSVRGRAGQDLTVHQTLTDAPVVVQQVAEVGDVQSNLP